MVGAIKDKLFQRHFRKLNISDSEETATHVNRLTSVTILAKMPFHSVSEVEEAIRYFRRNGLICQGYLIETRNEIELYEGEVDLITKDDVEWYGVPKKDLLIKWLSYKTDLLISLNPDRSALMRYLCAASSCKLKSAIDYGTERDRAIDFYLQLKEVESRNVRELCSSIYEELKNVS